VSDRGFTESQLNWSGKRVTIVGLAREGTAAARYCAERGAVVTVTDLKDSAALQSVLAELAGVPVSYVLGSHPPSVLECDVLFISPGVPLDAPIMILARQRGLTLCSEARLFARLCPAPIVGITGSSGKTTTSTLAARMLEEAGQRVFLGGNIGFPLLNRIAEIRPTDIVVMELSSFQLDFFAPELDAAYVASCADLRKSPLFPSGGWSPHLAVVLNVTPNHLDRHPSMDAYIDAKRNIVRYQQPGDVAVLGWDDPTARGFRQSCAGRVSFFSLHERVPDGAYLRDEDTLVLVRRSPRGAKETQRGGGTEADICQRSELILRGMHNVANVLAACALSSALDVPVESMAHVARTFAGVEHRLELVRELDRVRYYNDSIATSPERAMAALASFDEPIVLLAGGRDKHLPWQAWSRYVQRKAVYVITFGEAAGLIERALGELCGAAPPVQRAESLAHAVELAHELAQAGQVVLFSPGGTSFDAFRDYVERGQVFKKLVAGLTAARPKGATLQDGGRDD
jgi:UDP-N-acetylmuramoylalanine--D-glutamate ligase